MKKALRYILSLFCCVMCVPAAAEESERYPCGDYEYVLLENGSAEIVGYTGEDTEITIPGILDGYSVASIGDKAFYYCDSLTSISIPDTVVSIGNYAFQYCDSLTDITIPDSVVYIGTNPFIDCYSLTDIRVSPDHPSLSVTDGVLFCKEDKRLVYCPWAFSGDYIIPEGIQIIGNKAFSNCYGLTGIIIPNSVVSLGNSAFESCASLTSVTIPNSVTSIGNAAFIACHSLTDITIPDSVESVGDYAFSLCEGLTSISLPDSVESIGEKVFQGCNDITITVGKDSFARQYCIDNNISYTYTDANN